VMQASATLESELTCPQCGHPTLEEMPTDFCRFFHECANCHVLLRPKPRDCCVFCSYGSVKCPPVQLEGSCCSRP
jgi:hypothetical protein